MLKVKGPKVKVTW